MSGSTVFYPGPLPVARSSDQLLVFRFFDKAEGFENRFEYLPWVKCLGVTIGEGANPGTARFRFSFGDPYGEWDDPQRFEQVFPLNATGPKIVNADDRLVVRRVTEEGISEYLFDGFVQAPQADLDAETETVSFAAVGTPIREWDTPLAGARMRDASDPVTVDGHDFPTDLPARLNPDGKPNASPINRSDPPGGDSGEPPNEYPVFLGPFWPSNKVNDYRVRMWTLAMAARYIIVRGTTQLKDDGTDDKPSKYVTFDDLSYLDDLLTAWSPTTAEGFDAWQAWKAAHADQDSTLDDLADADAAYFQAWKDNDTKVIDEGDDGTFVIDDIEAPDLDVTGMAWPAALQRLIEPYGFSFRFELSEGEPDVEAGDDELEEGQFGDPKWTLKVYWKESESPAKTLRLQKAGETLDPGRTNVSALSLTRDSSSVANRVAIDAAPIRVESAFVLAPLFHIDPADATNTTAFVRNSDDWGDTDAYQKYRLYGFDECGEGHWKFTGTSGWFNTTGNLQVALTPPPEGLNDPGPRTFPVRRRPGLSTLVSRNPFASDPVPNEMILLVSFDYTGDQPGIWNGTGTWQIIAGGEWRLCEDRLGVFITTRDPDNWPVGTKEGGLSQLSDGVLSLVSLQAQLVFDRPYPRLMLVCAIDGDDDFNVVAGKRASSTTRYTVTRRVDARERHRKQVVSRYSWYASEDDFMEKDLVVRDDTADAQSLADAERRHSESCTFAGTATIPRLSTAYQIGDKVTDIDGRGVSLRSNIGAEQDESPVYPSVVGISWNFDGGQSTTLTLSDERAAPAPRRAGRLRG